MAPSEAQVLRWDTAYISIRMYHGLTTQLITVGAKQMAEQTNRAWRSVSKTAPVMGPTGKQRSE